MIPDECKVVDSPDAERLTDETMGGLQMSQDERL